MKWIIAGRCIDIVLPEETFPVAWQNSFSTYRVTEFEKTEPDVQLFVEPVTWDRQVEKGGLKPLYDLHGNVCQAEVTVPYANGILSKVNSSISGEFQIGVEDDCGLQLVLRTALSLMIEESGGLQLHASGVWNSGKLWVFSGPSGAGKTTVATELSPDGQLFAEDGVFLEFDSSGILIAHSSPFGELQRDKKCPSSGPVEGIVFIRQSASSFLLPFSVLSLTKDFLVNSRWCDRDGVATQRILSNIESILNTERCHQLAFEKTNKFWSLLENPR